MEFKSTAQAFFNTMPPSRQARENFNGKKVSPDDTRRLQLRRQIEIKKEQLALAREFQLC
jgi:hypothetical protein